MKALEFCDVQPPPPVEIVAGVVRPGRVTLITGREGSGKSFAVLAMAVAVARGVPWLGCETEAGRVMVLDMENPVPDAVERSWGLGLRAADQDSIRVYAQQGVNLGDRESVAKIERELEEFEPRVLIVDGAVSCSAVDPNSNADVTRLMGRLRLWAGRYQMGVVALHHVSKDSGDDPDAVLGAVGWRTQSDAHLSAIRAKPHHETETLAGGGTRDLYRYALRTSSKMRWGPRNGQSQTFVVVSERDRDGALQWLRVEPEGDLEQRQAKPSTEARIVTALQQAGRTLATDELAEAISRTNSGSLRGTLKSMAELGKIQRDGAGWMA